MSYIKYEYINYNPRSRPMIKNNGIKGLIMHYTANAGGTARNHKSYFNNLSMSYASAHLFVDDDEALCIIPFNEVTYHANDTVKYNANGTIYKPLYGKIGNANYSTIGLEMCLDKNGKITETTFKNSVKAVKELVKIYPAITRDTIWRHYDVTGKNCPAPWVAKPSELERFKEAVFGSGKTTTPAKTEAVKTPEKTPTSTSTTPKVATGQIATIQKWLNSTYKSGLAVDNSAGTATKKAIIKAVQTEMNKQYKSKLAVDGSFGPASKTAWIAFTQGASGNLTKLVQAMLYAKGYNPNGFDGSFGAGCKKAVIAFQKASKLTQDGWVGKATASALFK